MSVPSRELIIGSLIQSSPQVLFEGFKRLILLHRRIPIIETEVQQT